MSNLNHETIEPVVTEPDTAAVPAVPVKEVPFLRCLIAKILRPSVRQALVIITDQGFCSIANFLTGVLVARACSKAEYGLYVLGFTLLLTLQLVQRCLVSVPFTVHSPHLKSCDHAAYLGSTLIHHLVISGVAAVGFVIAVAVVSGVSRTDGFEGVLLALAVASVFVFLRDFMRYVLLAQLRVWASLLMGLAANIATVGMLFWAYMGAWLTAPVAYIILGGCSGLPAIMILLSRRKHVSIVKNRLVSDLKKNWRFGRWTLAATGASTIGIHTIPWFVLLWCGSSSVAVFGALMAVAGIIRPAILGVAAYLTPKLAHHVKSGGPASAIKAGMKVVRIMAISVVIYVVFMWALGEKIVGVLYTVRYQGHLTTLGIIAIGTGLGALSTTLKSLIRAIGNPEIEFWSSGCASIVCVLTSIYLIPRFGIVGAALAVTGWNLTFTVVTGLRIAWMTHKSVTSCGIQMEA